MSSKEYRAPSHEVCQFLIHSLTKLSEFEEYDTRDLAKRLSSLYDGPRTKLHQNDIADSFPWLYQIGLITYESKWDPRGGYHTMIRKDASSDIMRRFLSNPPDVLGDFIRATNYRSGSTGGSKVPVPDLISQSCNDEVKSEAAPELPEQPSTTKDSPKKKKPGNQKPPPSTGRKPKPKQRLAEAPKPKKKKKCCDDPHIVKSKKTGKRRCKNCGKKLKPKKRS